MFKSGAFFLSFTVFFHFFGFDYFINGFPNPFKVYSRPIFLFERNSCFSLVLFSFTCCILTSIFRIFKIFWSYFYRNYFPNSVIVCSMSIFLFSQRKCFELYLKTCAAIISNFVIKIFVSTIWRHNLLFVQLIMKFQLNCVRDVIFCS